MNQWRWIAILGMGAVATAAVAQDVPALVQKQLPGLVANYQELHQHPELSHFEANTSAWLAA